MKTAIRSAIVESILSGHDLDAAYEAGARAAAEELDAAARNGISVGEAGRLLGISGLDGVDEQGEARRHMLYVIVSGGRAATVPNAACVAEKLKGKPRPTREDINAAFAACGRQ